MTYLGRFDESFWRELEVNYPRVDELVCSDLADQCTKLSRISEISVKTMCAFLEESYSRPKTEALENIGKLNKTPINVMIALSEFMKRKDGNVILSYFNGLDLAKISENVLEFYDYIKDNPEKDLRYERLLFLLLFHEQGDDQPHVLQQIMALDAISSVNIPRYEQDGKITNVGRLLKSRINDLLKRLEKMDTKNMRYTRFCEFKKDRDYYCFIKRQIDDRIDRQVGTNIRSKPAEFISYIFIDEGRGLQIRSSRRRLARNSIRVFQERMNLKFVRKLPTISIDDFRDFPEKALNVENKLKLVGIQVKNSPFDGAPNVSIWSNSGIVKCLSQLKGLGFNLLDPKNLKKITVIFKGEKTISFNMERMEVPTYGTAGLSLDEQIEFENLVKREYGFPVVPKE